MEAIQDYFTTYKQSAWEKDAGRMIGLYDDHVVIFDMWEQGFQTGLAGWSVVIRDWFGSLGDERVNVIFEMIDIHEGDKVGFASALISFQAIAADNAVVRSMKNRITVGFIKRSDGWKVIHQHISAPVDAELKAIMDF